MAGDTLTITGAAGGGTVTNASINISSSQVWNLPGTINNTLYNYNVSVINYIISANNSLLAYIVAQGYTTGPHTNRTDADIIALFTPHTNRTDADIRDAINGSGFYNIQIDCSNINGTDDFCVDTSGSGTELYNSSNISIDSGVISLNLTCEQITGSADLCDGDDNAGAGSFDWNYTATYGGVGVILDSEIFNISGNGSAKTFVETNKLIVECSDTDTTYNSDEEWITESANVFTFNYALLATNITKLGSHTNRTDADILSVAGPHTNLTASDLYTLAPHTNRTDADITGLFTPHTNRTDADILSVAGPHTNLTETNVEAYIFDHDNTANLNLSNYNITNVQCIIFMNGAEDCGQT